MPTKILIFSDSPSANSGLARITRDLAVRISKMDDFEVATLGYGHCGSSQLPFMQYQWNQRGDFLPLELPFIYQDFCQGEGELILLTIGDVQRFLPLADPKFSQDRGFGEWLTKMRAPRDWTKGEKPLLQLWGYFPIDAHSLGGKLGPQLGHTLSHYDRILVPSEWAARIVKATLPHATCSVLPHGIDTDVFKPYPKEESRDRFGELLAPVMQWPKEELNIPDDALWVGIVAQNQPSKDWALGIEVVGEIAKTRPVMLWCHVDRLKHDNGWSLLELISDFGLLQKSMVSVGNVPDETMAVAYSSMDLTLGIGRGEGFSFTNFESIFSGTPCFAGTYGAHAEYMDPRHLVQYDKLRLEGPLNLLRPIYSVKNWVDQISSTAPASIFGTLDWINLWPSFENWLREQA